jgi:hypothetical protein
LRNSEDERVLQQDPGDDETQCGHQLAKRWEVDLQADLEEQQQKSHEPGLMKQQLHTRTGEWLNKESEKDVGRKKQGRAAQPAAHVGYHHEQQQEENDELDIAQELVVRPK